MQQDKELTMKERFKRYLEREFKTIAPTQAAMEYRKQTLKQMMDRAQELRIKGITDEELLYDMVVDELGDFRMKLEEFQNREVKTDAAKRKISMGTAIGIAVMAALTLTYLLVGVCAHIWHPTWLIMVGGVFAGVIVILGIVGAKLVKAQKFMPLRGIVIVCEVLVSVFIFLLLQLVVGLSGSWMTFLAMVVLLLGSDTALAFATNNKLKWIELPIFIEVFCVMLYVILGLSVNGIWHPGWLLCLGGVVAAIIQVVVMLAIRNKNKETEEKQKIENKHKKVDEAYWTEWDD